MTYLPDALYAQIESSVPIACVDFVPVRPASDGGREIGLILRDSPHGQVWCHLGGRVQRGETIAQALRRHAIETLAVDLSLPLNPQPAFVYEWFPPDIAPGDGTTFGDDPRKHSIGLSFVVEIAGEPRAADEALDFRYFSLDALPRPLWPGCEDLLARLGLRDYTR
jgi:ADP-ribose pyrophosphatase YjhB (NUDIX family)